MAVYPSHKEEIFGNTYLREVGYYICIFRENYLRALKYLENAVTQTPNDKRALLGRSWARAKACQYQGAISDINKALELFPDDIYLLTHKALSTYLSCEFEDALVQNTKNVKIRKQPDNFAMGVMHCKEAIENCIGKRAGHPLRDYYFIIRKLAWRAAFEAARPFEISSRFGKKKKRPARTKRKKEKHKKVDIEESESLLSVEVERLMRENKYESVLAMVMDDSPASTSVKSYLEDAMSEIRDSLYTLQESDTFVPRGKPLPFKPLQRRTSNLKNYMSERYLGSLYLDKMFLERLCTSSDFSGVNEEGVKTLTQLVKRGYKQLSYKQELLRTRRPFYFLKYQECEISGTLKIRQEKELQKMQALIKHEADTILKKLIAAIRNGEVIQSLEFAEKLKTYCDGKSRRLLPDRDKFLSKIYELVCFSHYSLKRMNEKENEADREKRILVMLGLPVSRVPSTDSVIPEYKATFVDHRKMIRIYMERVENAQSDEELSWLYHELARFHYESRNFEMSRFFARKCILIAKKIENLRWVVNAQVLLVRINVQTHNKNEAKSEVLNCMETAKLMSDPHLLTFLQACLAVIEKTTFDICLGENILAIREKKILSMLQSEELKGEAAFLFRQIAGLPASRRMTVVPGIKLEKEPDKEVAERGGGSTTPSLQLVKPKKDKDRDKSMEFFKNDVTGASFLNLLD